MSSVLPHAAAVCLGHGKGPAVLWLWGQQGRPHCPAPGSPEGHLHVPPVREAAAADAAPLARSTWKSSRGCWGQEGLCRNPPCLCGHGLAATAPGAGTPCLCELPGSQPCAAGAGRSCPRAAKGRPHRAHTAQQEEIKGQNAGLDVCSA